MGREPRISEAEWDVMRVVWDKNPIMSSEVVDRLADARSWSPRTVKTLLGRLVRKGALAFSVQGKSYLYRPKVTRTECIRVAGKSFVDRLFGGAAAPMLAHFVEHSDLTPEEITKLKQMLKQKEEK
jgi:BlaI family transcriptional regulator, penicillinase repressor